MIRREYTANSFMNITSLVDIALNLLVIFMIAGPMIHSQIDVALPETKAKALTQESHTVTITKDGRVYLGEKIIAPENLTEALRELKMRKGLNAVSLRADKDVNYGLVMKVIGYIKEAGIETLGLVVIPERKTHP
jgi:biopolymer transport protein TolR